jgi:hypothetical protein
VLTDIMGDEDHLGDMDFKVAGTADGINALQMDIKIEGITREIMETALEQAKDGRLHILGEMNKVIDRIAPRCPTTPRASSSSRSIPEKIRDVIGKGGATIRAITEETGAAWTWTPAAASSSPSRKYPRRRARSTRRKCRPDDGSGPHAGLNRSAPGPPRGGGPAPCEKGASVVADAPFFVPGVARRARARCAPGAGTPGRRASRSGREPRRTGCASSPSRHRQGVGPSDTEPLCSD